VLARFNTSATDKSAAAAYFFGGQPVQQRRYWQIRYPLTGCHCQPHGKHGVHITVSQVNRDDSTGDSVNVHSIAEMQRAHFGQLSRRIGHLTDSTCHSNGP